MKNPQLTSYKYLQWWKTDAFLLKSGAEHNDQLSALLFSIPLEGQGSAIKQEKEVKGIYIGKEELKLSLMTDIMIIFVENLTVFTKKLS